MPSRKSKDPESGPRRRLILLGGGDFAREVEWFISLGGRENRNWDLAGYLDDSEPAPGRRAPTSPYLGKIVDHDPAYGNVYVPAIAKPQAKLTVCEAIRDRGGVFENVLHPSAVIAPDAKIGVGVVMAQNVTISVGVIIGDFVTINFNSTAGHDSVLEDGCTLSSFCDVTGHVHLDRGAFLGSHASVLPGVTVGAFATVGAGSVVLRKVPPGRIVLGVPAKVVL